jgi:hypothetical protein
MPNAMGGREFGLALANMVAPQNRQGVALSLSKSSDFDKPAWL